MTHSFPTRRYSELKFVHELRPCNLDAGNKRNLAHVRLVDAPVPQRHIGTLHLVETDKVPERSKCLRTEHLEFIIVKDQGQLEPRKSEQQSDPDQDRNASAAPPHRELMTDELGTASEIPAVSICLAMA